MPGACKKVHAYGRAQLRAIVGKTQYSEITSAALIVSNSSAASRGTNKWMRRRRRPRRPTVYFLPESRSISEANFEPFLSTLTRR